MIPISATTILFLACAVAAFAQPEVMAWGNLTGLRIEGHLLELATSLCVAQSGLGELTCTAREKQQNTYSRHGKIETVAIQMRQARWSMNATESVEDTGPGTARIAVEFTSPGEAQIGGAFLAIDLPADVFSGGSVDFVEADPETAGHATLASGGPGQTETLRATAKGARFLSRARQLEVTFDERTAVIVRRGNQGFQALLAVLTGKTGSGQTGKRTFSFKVTGEIDQNPVEITLDPSHPGQLFDGLGGNFRLQNPRTDPPAIDYNLENLRVAWGRVEMPWSLWHPEEDTDPLSDARSANVNPQVRQAMEMARRLARKGIPVIVSAWQAPLWAVLNAPAGADAAPQRSRLNPAKMERIRDSITAYLLFLKEKYGVEAAMFSFNESDIGINVLQSPREHAELIQNFGAWFARQGLATKLALGDTSDANPIDFIKPAMRDPEAVRYVAALDFHSWRGCTDERLAEWRDAARELNVPLVVAEGSTDAAAWRYPQIFAEQSFALYEINLYLRILSIAQPRSILQWQLTADYSLLAGGGIFNDNGPLRPTRRFWNLKQLAATPPRSFSLPVSCNQRPNLTCAAFGNLADGIYTVHIVNNGATRQATLTGLPTSVKELRAWVTDAGRGMAELDRIPALEGKAEFPLPATSYTTVIGVSQ